MRRTGARIAAGLFTLSIASPALAVTYQVGPGKPYATLGDVAGLLAPGDLVEVDGDATYPGGVVFDQPGTNAAKITIRGLRINGNRPVLTGGNNTIEAAADHYVFEGFDLTQGASRCFYHHGDDITLRDSVIHDCPTHGLLGADADSGSLLLEYTEVHHCGGGTQHHQIYMATDETAHPGSVFRMQHCWVHDANGGNAVKSRAERNEIHSNWIEGALYHELELIGPDGQDPALAREDSDVSGNVLLKRNTFYVTRFGGDGTGETNGRYRFVNNTVVVLPGGSAVFRLFDGIESVEMHNNVFFMDGGGGVNLVRQLEAAWTNGIAVFAGSNNWVAAGSTNVPQEWTGTVSGADPGFADMASLDLRPLMGSPLVDAGTLPTMSPPGYAFPSPLPAPLFHPPLHTIEPNGGAQARPTVGAIDIGAYEFGVDPGAGGAGGATGSGGGSTGSGGGATGSGGGGGAPTGAGGGATGSGSTSSGGPGSGGGAAGGTGGAPGNLSNDVIEDTSCGCRVPARSSGAGSGAILLALAGLALRRSRRRARARG